MIDVVDLVAVIVAWGSDGSQNNSDITGDGVVDVADLVAVIVAWGPIDCGSNGPPVADAGPDQFLVDRNEDGVEQILLDGSASTDDGLIVAYEWAEDGVLLGSGVVVEVALAVGEHAITLTVTDDEELSDSDLIHVTVAAPLQPQAPRSDDFSQSILDPAIWTYIDPLGDAGLEILGTGTSDAVVQICVPEGVTHDAATLNNAAPRIMQAIGDVDFEVEVKFESEPLLQTQIQGIFIEQDAANFQRFDFFSDGSSLRVFAASFAEDVQITRINQAIPAGLPLFMRVQRQGNQWTQLYSTDGLAWTQAVSFAHSMQVVSVGVLAGNAVADPAYTAIIDYFFNTAAPVLPEDPIFPGPPILSDIQIQSGFTSALVTWSTNEPANGTVRYGLSEALELGEVADEALVYSHAAVITGLLPDSTYHLRIESIDSEGLMAESDVVAFQTSDSSSNQSPTAVAGSDQVLIDGDGNGIESMTLDGSGSRRSGSGHSGIRVDAERDRDRERRDAGGHASPWSSSDRLDGHRRSARHCYRFGARHGRFDRSNADGRWPGGLLPVR